MTAPTTFGTFTDGTATSFPVDTPTSSAVVPPLSTGVSLSTGPYSSYLPSTIPPYGNGTSLTSSWGTGITPTPSSTFTSPSNATTSGYYGIPSISISTLSWNQTSSVATDTLTAPTDTTVTETGTASKSTVFSWSYTYTGPSYSYSEVTPSASESFINRIVKLPDYTNTIKLDSLLELQQYALLDSDDSDDSDKHAKLVFLCFLFTICTLVILCALVVVYYIPTVAAGLHTYYYQSNIQLKRVSFPLLVSKRDDKHTLRLDPNILRVQQQKLLRGASDPDREESSVSKPSSTPTGTYTDATNSSWDVPTPTPSTLSTATSPRSSSAEQSETDGYYGPPQPTKKTSMGKRAMQGTDNDDGVAKMNVAVDGAMQTEMQSANEKPKEGLMLWFM
ncbi:hypothetical protein ST47_g3861 [Ascochyta rabiei]|uniref:Uncharacterized protein n=1 Tax=Didymella rabiei TaxID=5454 RepID=A0A163GRB8_DIDRA|nr:hypothetical protein ST47_g3861 [Ascochyta rabiei]